MSDNNDFLDMKLTADSFAEGGDSQGGFEFLGQVISVQKEPGKPDFKTKEPTEQIHVIVKNLGYYIQGEMTPASEERKPRHEWATIKFTKKGQVNKRTKLGAILFSFEALFGETSPRELEGKVAWFRPTDITFGETREGEPMVAKDVLLPIRLPTAEELQAVGSPEGATSAAAPADLEYTDDEVTSILDVIDGKTLGDAQLAVIGSTLPAGIKSAILSGKAISALKEKGVVEVGSDNVIHAAVAA